MSVTIQGAAQGMEFRLLSFVTVRESQVRLLVTKGLKGILTGMALLSTAYGPNCSYQCNSSCTTSSARHMCSCVAWQANPKRLARPWHVSVLSQRPEGL